MFVLHTKKVNKFETSQGRTKRFKAHTGRFTVTTLALFGQCEETSLPIAPELVEHQMHWTRGSSVLPNYMGHNVTFVKNGFFDKIKNLRDYGGDTNIDEQSITAYNLKETTVHTIQSWSDIHSLNYQP